jgi:ERCC4-type nuclease
MEILCDDREPKEIYYQLENKLNLNVRRLRLERGRGDYCFSDIVMERKTIEDLIASLYDNRLWDQLKAMKEHMPDCYVIIEGRLPVPYTRELYTLHKKLSGIIVGITKGFKIPTIPSDNMSHTAYIVGEFFVRSSTDKKDYLRPVKKSSGPEPEDIKSDILSALPGIGRRKADQLLEAFGSVRGVAEASADDLRKLPGIGKKRSELIVTLLNT